MFKLIYKKKCVLVKLQHKGVLYIVLCLNNNPIIDLLSPFLAMIQTNQTRHHGLKRRIDT